MSSTLSVTLTVETSYALNVFENDCLSPLDRQCHYGLCGGVEEMTSPSGSSLSLLRGYDPSCPMVVSFERCYYSHCSLCYSDSLRQIIVTSLIVVADIEITKITIHSNC